MVDGEKKKWVAFGLLFFLLVGMVNLPNALLFFKTGVYRGIFGSYLVNLALLSIPVFLFYNHIRILFFLLLPVALLSPVAGIAAYDFRSKLNANILLLALESSPNDWMHFFAGWGWIFITSLVLFSGIFILLVRKLPRRLPFRGCLLWSLSGASCMFLLPLVQYGLVNYSFNLSNMAHYFYPWYLQKEVRIVGDFWEAADAHEVATAAFQFGASKKDTLREKEIYVFVLGETARFDRWHLNGYHRPTSPNLDSIPGIVSFQNMTTSGSYTSLAAPIILTRATPENWARHFNEKSFIAAFKEAGFTTYWLSNPAAKGTLSIDVHALDADHYHLLQPGENGQNQYDGALVQRLQQLLRQDTSQKIMAVLHTIGSHWRYENYYPDSFDVFRPSGKTVYTTAIDKSAGEILNNSYDNSILYTDFVLGNLVKVLQNLQAVSAMIYLSDHGENLMDDALHRTLHAEPSIYTIQVPFFIWTSSKYQSIYKDKYLQMDQKRDSMADSRYLFYTILDLANIDFPGFEASFSLANPGYKAHPRSILLNNNQEVVSIKDIFPQLEQ